MGLLADHLAVFMIVALGVLLFSGYLGALVLAGVGLSFGLIGHMLGVFPLAAYWEHTRPCLVPQGGPPLRRADGKGQDRGG